MKKFTLSLLSFSFLELGAWNFGLGSCLAQQTYTDTINKIVYDSRDSTTYPIEKIGNQWWMTENLDIGDRVNSINPALGADSLLTQTNNGIIEKYCYNNDTAYCSIYGGLYQWNEMMQYSPSDTGDTGTTQGICPTGWHIPTDLEYQQLILSLDASAVLVDGSESSIAGGKLKETGTTHWSSPNIATNESGFTALPGGERTLTLGDFNNLGEIAFFWSATEYSSTNAWIRSLTWGIATVYRDYIHKWQGYSVRCLKDIDLFDPLTISAVVVGNVACNGDSTGAATVTATDGTPPYMYLWNTGIETQGIASLHADIYYVTVTDADMNTAVDSVEITEPAQLIVSLGNDIAICTGGTATITATVTGGTSPYTYLWNTGCTDMLWHVSAGGTYGLTVTDANGCTASDDIILNLLPLPQLTISTANATCGNDDGSAQVTATGGTPPYTCQWTSGSLTNETTDLYSGTYVVTVTDTNGCSAGATALVSDNGAPVITVVSVTNIDCYGNANGAIDISITGGMTPYAIEWSNGATTEDISGLTAAPYQINVIDAQGCAAAMCIIVTQPEPLATTVSATLANCGNTDGTATLFVSGGTSPYTYLWNTGDTSTSLSGLSVGIYDATVTDANGCIDSIAVSISEAGGPILTIDTIIDVACGQANGAIDINVSGGVSPYTYQWNTGATTEDITELTFGRYMVTVTGANSCRAALSDIVVKALPSPLPIGFVTVDSITKKNMILWRNLDTAQISHYRLYRESSQQDVYYLLAQVPYDSLIIFFDTLSKPDQHSWKYKISVVDLCGRESYLSNGHRTMHLKVKKFDNYIRLTWNKYEGFAYEQFYIYRAVEPQPYVLLDSVASTENMYIDTLPPQGVLHYVLEVLDTAVVNLVLKEASHNSSRSNDDCDGIYVSMPEITQHGRLLIYPNPFDQSTTIEFSNTNNTGYTITISDITGKKVYGTVTTKNKVEFKRGVLQPGVYIVKVIGDAVYLGKMVVK
ncbi:MAG: T9SS type A sorting domain-containing protein [Bacteroidia bacterium]|nr:T9SS type A sorting domain-containing protein [Bacteroidia bacterium]